MTQSSKGKLVAGTCLGVAALGMGMPRIPRAGSGNAQGLGPQHLQQGGLKFPGSWIGKLTRAPCPGWVIPLEFLV